MLCEASSRLWMTTPRIVRHGKRYTGVAIRWHGDDLADVNFAASTVSYLPIAARSMQAATSSTENATVPMGSAVTTVSSHVCS